MTQGAVDSLLNLLQLSGPYECLGFDVSGGKSVSMQKIWHLIQGLVDEDSAVRRNISRKMSLVIGTRQHLEWGHEKYVLDTIQSHPAQDCIGMIDGTHVEATVPLAFVPRFRGRKGVTQNILAVCMPDKLFTYVLKARRGSKRLIRLEGCIVFTIA